MRSLVCLPFCLVMFLFCLIPETSQRPSTCCLQTSKKRIPINRVLSYTVQEAGVCHISAIVLFTVRQTIMCIDPDSEWIKDLMRTVDQKNRQNKNPICRAKMPKDRRKK